MSNKIKGRNKKNKKSVYKWAALGVSILSSVVAFLPKKPEQSQSVKVDKNSGVVYSPMVLGDSDDQSNQLNINYNYSSKDGCKYDLCENFIDMTAWTSNPNLVFTSTAPFEAMAVNDEKQRGGSIFLKNKWFGPNFTMVFNAIPCGPTQSNLILSYGDSFDYIIGDGGYERLAISSNGNYINPLGFNVGHFTLAEQIKSCTPIQLRMEVTTSNGPKALVVNSWLTYTGISGKNFESVPIPKFIVPTVENVWTIQNNVGVGLRDWQKIGNVRAFFKSLTIQSIL